MDPGVAERGGQVARDTLAGRSAALGLIVLAKLVVQALALPRYGYFRDELYYLACADHLAWGYVDHPPLSIAILWLQRALFGDSLFALRALPALAGCLTILLTARLARDLGGGRFAQTLAALAALVSPIYLGIDHYFSMNAFDLALWPLAAWLLLRALATGRTAFWAALGLVLGAGLLNKMSVLWLGAGIALGLLATPHRRVLAMKGPWIAAALAGALYLPHLVWQARHAWPTLEFMRNATSLKMVDVSLAGFVKGQILAMNPVTAPIWVAGLVWLFASRAGRPWRILGWIFLAVAAILVLAGRSRASYLAPAYPMVLAAGAVALEGLPAAAGRSWIRAAAAAVLVIAGMALAPFGLPLLPVETYLRYARALGAAPSTEEHLRLGELPQHYADMFGWEEMAAVVARAYAGLSPRERDGCGIFAQNYGEAGAIDFFGRRYGLPRALSGHNSYWMWGPGERPVDVVIVVGGDLEDNRQAFETLEQAGTIRCDLCMPYERDLPVYIGRAPKAPLARLWPRLKKYV